MSSKLVMAEEATDWTPMPWITTGSQGPRAATQMPVAGMPPAGTASQGEDLRAKIAALEQRVVQAQAAGRAEGEAQAKQAVQAELQSVFHKLATAIHDASELRARLREQAESDMVRLAIAIARRVVGRELNTDVEAITGLVKAGLEKLRVQDILRVRLNPMQKTIVGEYLARSGATHVEVIGDPACEQGAVIFETSRGNLDASVETQLREIERGLTDRFKGRAV